MSFVLTDDNYYSPEADIAFMSCSQYQGFLECEAKQLAKIQGRWTDKPSEAFLVGNYFHSHFESPQAHEKFCGDNFDSIFKTKEVTIKRATKDFPAIKETVITGKYAPFERADKMIKTLEDDPLMQTFLEMDGQNEIFMIGEIFGVPWRMKMDKYIQEQRMIIDYKTVANIWETSYNAEKGQRETFVEAYGYLFRAAVYSLVEAENEFGLTFDEAFKMLKNDALELAHFFLLCVSKQEYPDKKILRLNNRQEYIYELEKIKDRLFRVMMIKDGRLLPKRCGMCDYCRATNVLNEVIPYYELMPEYRREREDDYAAKIMDNAPQT